MHVGSNEQKANKYVTQPASMTQPLLHFFLWVRKRRYLPRKVPMFAPDQSLEKLHFLTATLRVLQLEEQLPC